MAKPHEVTDAEFAFGFANPERHLPSVSEEDLDIEVLRSWRAVVTQIRINGLDPDSTLVFRAGVDRDRALRHLGAALASPVPPEDKDLRIAVLLSKWLVGARLPGGVKAGVTSRH